jgi:hydrogenase maturation protease
MANNKKITVIGVGNEIMSDEGIGVHVIRELHKLNLPPGVELIEGGTDGFGLINVIFEADRLIVIDSLKGGNKPGTIYKFDIKDAPNCPDIFKTSVHQIGILEVIHLSRLIGKTPATTVIGIEPESLRFGMELTTAIKEKIPKIMDLIFKEINELGEHDHLQN